MEPLIGEKDLDGLKSTIVWRFPEFRRLYRKQEGHDPLSAEGLRRARTNWTCFIKGKAQRLKVDGWHGIFRPWLESRLEPTKGISIHAETWYRVDFALIDERAGGWFEGDYRILVLFEQENEPKEIKGHVRQFYDLNAPTKILLIWTWDKKHRAKDLFRKVDEVAESCEKNGLPTMGNIHVIVGDWRRLVKHLRNETSPRPDVLDSVFQTRTIPGTV
jgi:hypothetical protein